MSSRPWQLRWHRLKRLRENRRIDRAKTYKDLEERLVDVIQECCPTDNDKEAALAYFRNVTVNEMIKEALEG